MVSRLLKSSPCLARFSISKFGRCSNPIQILSGRRWIGDDAWNFPQPPPPPSKQELHDNGLPILHRASLHAAQGSILLSEWPREDGTVDVATYKDVLSRARLVSETLLQSKKNDSTGQRNLVAHLNIPGWEYVATQWGEYLHSSCKISL